MLIKIIKNISKLVRAKKIDGFSINNKCIKVFKNNNHYYFKSTKKENLLTSIQRFPIDPLNTILKINSIEHCYIAKGSNFSIEIIIGDVNNATHVSFNLFYNNSLTFTSITLLEPDKLHLFLNSCLDSYLFYKALDTSIINSLTREMSVLINETVGDFVLVNFGSVKITKIHHEIKDGKYRGIIVCDNKQVTEKTFFEHKNNLFMPTKSLPSNYGKISNYGLEYNFPSLMPYMDKIMFVSNLKFFNNLFILYARNNEHKISIYLSNIDELMTLEIIVSDSDETTSTLKYLESNKISINVLDNEVLDLFLTYFLDKKTLESYEMTSPLSPDALDMIKLLHY